MSSTQQLLLGEGAGGGPPVFIEDVFSTFLYTGNATARSITNNIDLSTKGGLVWGKNRAAAAEFNRLSDTVRGGSKLLYSNSTSAEATQNNISAFNTTGFSLTDDSALNYNTNSYVSWTFREQPKFFDVVTYTGTGSFTTVAHNLGSVPGCIIVKRTDSASDWAVYHRSLGNTKVILLNTTAAEFTDNWWNDTTPTSTQFYLSTDPTVNGFGATYVAYLFAHNAGGFGLTGTDNVISCGSFVSDASGGISPVNLGFEPQWLLVKNTSADGWRIQDVMRPWSQTQLQDLSPNSADAERLLNNNPSYLSPTATGFSTPTPGLFTASNTFIYIAIRRGPMKVPTSGTTVFTPSYFTGDDSTSRQLTAGFVTDTFLGKRSIGDTSPFVDRLRGKDLQLYLSVLFE